MEDAPPPCRHVGTPVHATRSETIANPTILLGVGFRSRRGIRYPDPIGLHHFQRPDLSHFARRFGTPMVLVQGRTRRGRNAAQIFLLFPRRSIVAARARRAGCPSRRTILRQSPRHGTARHSLLRRRRPPLAGRVQVGQLLRHFARGPTRRPESAGARTIARFIEIGRGGHGRPTESIVETSVCATAHFAGHDGARNQSALARSYAREYSNRHEHGRRRRRSPEAKTINEDRQ
mmetsp:Transcript_21470/g.59537  ORF Transcript_21470/g.59537 Transcript_21470/m.59537 type:complete len:233 (-) Transcript_21470:482-1180(-)